jgi:hypothetical protein
MFVLGIDEAEKQTNRGMPNIFVNYIRHDARDFFVSKRLNDAAVGGDAFAHGEAIFAGRDWRWTDNMKRVKVGTVLTPDQQQIGEAIRGNESDRLARALEQRVGGDGRAVYQLGGLVLNHLSNRFDHSALKFRRRRGNLNDRQRSAIHCNQISEGAADVDAYAHEWRLTPESVRAAS